MALRRYQEAIRSYIGCRTAFQSLAALATHDEFVTDQRRDDEIRELKDSIREIQSGQIKIAIGRDAMTARLEHRISDLERTKQRGKSIIRHAGGSFARAGQRVFSKRGSARRRAGVEDCGRGKLAPWRGAQQPRGALCHDRPQAAGARVGQAGRALGLPGESTTEVRHPGFGGKSQTSNPKSQTPIVTPALGFGAWDLELGIYSVSICARCSRPLKST